MQYENYMDFFNSAEKYPEAKHFEKNLVEGKRAFQRSMYNEGRAERAADGNFSPDFDQNSCMMCDTHDHGWWGVDLEQSYRILRVTVTNRNSNRKSSNFMNH